MIRVLCFHMLDNYVILIVIIPMKSQLIIPVSMVNSINKHPMSLCVQT